MSAWLEPAPREVPEERREEPLPPMAQPGVDGVDAHAVLLGNLRRRRPLDVDAYEGGPLDRHQVRMIDLYTLAMGAPVDVLAFGARGVN